MLHHSRTLLALILTAPSALAQSTWTVDDGGGADFSSLPAAVAFATDGDTLIVRAGTYEAITLDGKGLTIVGDGDVFCYAYSGSPFNPVASALTVRNLDPGQSLSVRGLEFRSFTLSVDDIRIVRIDDCAGPVLFEDCSISPDFSYGYPLEADGCDSLTLSRCSLGSGQTFVSTEGGFVVGPVPYTALSARETNLFLYETEFRGSRGAAPFELSGQLYPAPDPGFGVRLIGSTMLAVGCRMEGGTGQGADPAQLCAPGGAGAAGLTLLSFGATPSSGTLLDCEIIGGSGGLGTCGQPDGAAAPAVQDPLGALTYWPGIERTGVVDALVTEGGTANLSMTGPPGDFGVLLWSPTLAVGNPWLPEPTVFHVGLPLSFAVVGPLPATGTFSGSFTMPLLPPGVRSRTLVVQPVQIGSPLTTYEGGPTLLTITDASL